MSSTQTQRGATKKPWRKRRATNEKKPFEGIESKQAGTPAASASSSTDELSHEEEGERVDHRAWTSAQVRSRKRLTALVGVILFLAAFSASSNVLSTGCSGG